MVGITRTNQKCMELLRRRGHASLTVNPSHSGVKWRFAFFGYSRELICHAVRCVKAVEASTVKDRTHPHHAFVKFLAHKADAPE